jgi:hypothetical protein
MKKRSMRIVPIGFVGALFSIVAYCFIVHSVIALEFNGAGFHFSESMADMGILSIGVIAMLESYAVEANLGRATCRGLRKGQRVTVLNVVEYRSKKKDPVFLTLVQPLDTKDNEPRFLRLKDRLIVGMTYKDCWERKSHNDVVRGVNGLKSSISGWVRHWEPA